MRYWHKTVLATGLLGALVTPQLEAQRPLSLGLAGGVSLPQGSLSDGAQTGWHALGTLSLTSPFLPFGLRVDAAYNRFALSDEARVALGGGGHETVSSLTANLIYQASMPGSLALPYVIVGIGGYHTSCALDAACGSATRYGWNLGLGTKLNLAGVSAFAEARYHRTSRGGGSVNYFPLTLGVMF